MHTVLYLQQQLVVPYKVQCCFCLSHGASGFPPVWLSSALAWPAALIDSFPFDLSGQWNVVPS